MAVVRKKQDDKFLKVLRELVTTGGGNRQCFDCGQKGPTYVNMTIGSFVCTRCSGVLRGLTPPHRVKSISMATFTQEEIDFLRAHGNDLCAKTWLGLWDPKRAVHQDHRELMIDKYESKRYYLEPASPLKSLTNAASLKSSNSIGSGNGSSSNGRGTSNSNVKNSSSTTSSHVLQQQQQQQQQLTNGYGNHLNNGSGNSNSSNSGNSNNNNSGAINISSSNNQQVGGGFDSSFQNITLTPPTSQRTTQSGLHKSSSTAISRPQNGYHPSQSQHDAFMTKTGGGGGGALLNAFSSLHGHNVSMVSGSAASTAALSDTSSSASNGFGAEADFVADFGSANIFDATSSSSVGSPTVSSVATSNGYAKIQPMKATQFMNGVGGVGNHSAAAALMMNGNIRNQQNGVNGHSISSNTKNISENFADFDHAPIFNAAENYKFVRKRVLKKSSTSSILQDKPQQQQQQMMNSVTTTTTTTEDRNNFLNLRNHINNNNNSNTSSNNTKNCNNFYDFNSWHDIISLEEEKERKEERGTTNLNDCFNDDDFNFKHYNNSRITTAIHSNFGAEQKQHHEHQQEKMQQQPQQQKKFTPLAMAAHATAMAVLGSNSHFNVSNSNSNVSNDFDMQSAFAAPQWNSWQNMASVESPVTPTDGDSFWGHDTSRSSSDSSTTDVLANGLIPTPLTPFQSTQASSNAHFFTHNTAPVQAVQSVQSNSNAVPFPLTFDSSTSGGLKSTTTATASFSSTNPFLSHSDFNSILPDFDSSASSPAGFFAHRRSSSSTLDENSNVDSVPGWRLPMTNGYSNKQHAAASVKSATSVNNNMSSSQNHISNNNKNSTPAEDRYAALKDLDEQLRESKAVAAAAATVVATNVADAFGNNNNNAGTNVNPFKLQQQHAAMVNPFQATHQTQNLFGQMSTLTNGNLLTNGFQQPISAQQQQQQQQQQQHHHHHQQQQHQHTAFFNYSNGYTAAGAATSTMFPPPPAPSSGPNGCGFGFGSMQQQIAAAAGGGSGAFNNPFAATGGALNSNNPFL